MTGEPFREPETPHRPGESETGSASSPAAGAPYGLDPRRGNWRAGASLTFAVFALLLFALSVFAAAPARALVTTRTYALTTSVAAGEGSNAELTVTLGEAVPSGGLAFDARYDYSVSGATTADTGAMPTSVWVASGSKMATISVPIQSDRSADSGETFNVTIEPAGGVTGWSVAAGGTDTSTVTITDNAASITLTKRATASRKPMAAGASITLGQRCRMSADLS